jgi:polysaccharide export outer membrane protein
MRVALQLRTILAVPLVMFGVSAISQAADTGQTPSKELIVYIRDSRQRGVAESKIKKQAAAIGWSASEIDQAIAYEKGGKPLPTDPPVAPAPSAADAVPAPPETPAPVSGTPTARGEDYLIGAGDTLQISVWKEPEVTVPTVVVRPDGRITIPLIKEVTVGGLSPRQAEAVIAEGLGKFITEPNVTVVVAAFSSKKVYLIGAVRKEGPLPYTYGMTVMQALSEAGGLNDYAKRKKIYILRSESGQEYRLDFNYEEVVRGERMEQNVVLLPGDTVVIPQ